MKHSSYLVVWLAVFFVPVILTIAAATVKTAILSVALFWGALATFFFGEIRDYLKNRAYRK